MFFQFVSPLKKFHNKYKVPPAYSRADECARSLLRSVGMTMIWGDGRLPLAVVSRSFRDEIKSYGHDGIDSQKLRAFKPVGLAIG